MKVDKKNIDSEKLLKPADFAKMKGIYRTFVYKLIDEDKIDYAEIAGVTFVYLSERTLNYQKA